MLTAVIFDFGHTIMREDSCHDPLLEDCAIQLMPGAREAIDGISSPKGIWANTRLAGAKDVRRWLVRAGLDARIRWVITSFDLGYRKPEKKFFTRALQECGLDSSEIIFVGNQMNTDILGANRASIRSVYLADEAYRSIDEQSMDGASPTFTIQTLFELPALVHDLTSYS